MKPPRVSVITAVHNGDSYLEEALDSIRAQTYGDFEHVVVDDASCDKTQEILERIGRSDPRVRVLRNLSNMGRAASRNRALDESRGQYLAIMDADDVALPARLERQTHYLDRHPGVGVVGTWFDVIDENGVAILTRQLPTEPAEIRESDLAMMPFCHPSIMFRRECIENAGAYREEFTYAQDYDLLLRILERYAGANIPEVLVRYRINPGACSQRHAGLQQRFADLACCCARRRRQCGCDPIQQGDAEEVARLIGDATRLSWFQRSRAEADAWLSWCARFVCNNDTPRARRYLLRAVLANPLVVASRPGVLVRATLPPGVRRVFRRIREHGAT